MVLLNGVFNSESRQFALLLDLIWRKAEVLAVVGLPHWVFFHTGCDVQGSLLFLKRTDSPRESYSIHIDWAEDVGYDSKGQKTDRNDLPDILERYRKRKRGHQFDAAELPDRGRMDPLYYQPGDHDRVPKLAGPSAALTDVLIPVTECVRRKRDNVEKVQYIEVGDTDISTGAIISTKEYEIRDLPARAKYVVRENMLLIPNHRNSIKAGRSVVLVSREYDGLVVTRRFIAVRSKMPAVYLYHILNLDIVKEEMLRMVSGSSSTEIKFAQFEEILVPLPASGDFDLFLENVDARREKVSRLKTDLKEKELELENLFGSLY